MGDSTPICRCRVLYLGSAVPRQSKDGLQGIQEPLKGLYPPEGAAGARGIDSWLSVWSNGILLENVDENRKQVTRFFPIDSLHYCAAVRHVLVPERGQSAPEPKFLPLDSPFARTPRAAHPPLFAAILRRTTGIKVLECHAFICKREAAANALVRCCFHAYADSSYARQAETGNGSVYGSLIRPVGYTSRAGSTTTINSVGRHPVTPATVHQDGYASSADLGLDDGSIYNGDENHKVWTGSQDRLDEPDGIYDIYSGGGSTLSRPARARQVSAPVQIAPPPISEKEKKKRQKRSNGHAPSASLAGTMMRPRPAPGQIMRGPGPVLYYPTQGVPMPVPGPHVRHFHTFSHRNRPPPPMMPMPMMVPQYAPQPQFAPQYPQYATLQAPKASKKKRNKERNGVVPLAPVAPIFAYPPTIERPLAHSNRKLAHSTASGLEEISAQTNGDVSPNGTGIYRRKGHLNERAFSYSIRQEHRSRSHGSLASLQFAPAPSLPPTNAEGREDLKKEREIMQLVAGLDLNGGPERPEHRREVPMQIPHNMAAGAYGKVRR